jgi:hypothetical protein
MALHASASHAAADTYCSRLLTSSDASSNELISSPIVGIAAMLATSLDSRNMGDGMCDPIGLTHSSTCRRREPGAFGSLDMPCVAHA